MLLIKLYMVIGLRCRIPTRFPEGLPTGNTENKISKCVLALNSRDSELGHMKILEVCLDGIASKQEQK